MAVLNNNYSDGVVWHDVACHFRSVIVCEDSDQLIALVQQQNAVDVSDTVKKGEDSRLVDPDAVIAEEERHEAELAALAARRPPRRPQGKYCLLSLNPRSNKQTICVFVCLFVSFGVKCPHGEPNTEISKFLSCSSHVNNQF